MKASIILFRFLQSLIYWKIAQDRKKFYLFKKAKGIFEHMVTFASLRSIVQPEKGFKNY